MYFDEPIDTAPINSNMDLRIVLSVNGLLVLAIGIMPESLMFRCAAAIKSALSLV
jgi:NADH-quinone oxidoreductase subunit N